MRAVVFPRAAVRTMAVLGAFVLSGCYTYLPVTAAPRGTEVRAHLPVETRVAGGATATETIPVEGTVVEFGDSLVLETTARTRVGNFREVTEVDTLRVATAELAGVEVKEFSRNRTLGFTALVVGGTALVIMAITAAAGGSDDGPPGGGGVGVSVTPSGILGFLGALAGGR